MSIPRWLALIAGLLLASALLWTAYENTLTPASPVGAGGGSDTAARALRAYGGQAAWRNAHAIESTVTVGGLLFQAKGINIPAHARFTIDVQRPHTVIDPVDAAGDVGVLDGFSVTIQSKDGRLLQQRDDARQHFQNASISIPWDALNLAYFLGYAFWGYFTLPNQLLRTDIRWTELAGGELQADYGSGLPVHSRIQRFWFDANSGLLRRNDYEPIAAAVGVKVANVVFEHAIAGGIPYAKKRRVKLSPVQYGWVLPAPDFITIDVESWRLS